MGWKVMGVDKCTYAANKENLVEFCSHKNFTFLEKDINDLESLYECDYVINVAAETHVGNSIIKNDHFIKTNVLGVSHLLNLIKDSRVDTDKMPVFFHFSTDEVYGDILSGSHNENDKLVPSNPYSATKASADMQILAWARTYKIPFIIIRPTNTYGPGQYIEKLIPRFCKYIQIDRKMPLMHNGNSVRAWLHVSDTVDAVLKIIETGKKNEIYNITSRSEYNIKYVCDKIANFYHPNHEDTNIFYDYSYQRPGHDLRYSLDDSKIRELGWKDNANFDLEILKIAEYYKDRFIW
jgi:dTDP-glucose 4,6-dehydratase